MNKKLKRALVALGIASLLAICFTFFTSGSANAAGFCVHHHSPDAGAAGAFVLQKGDGSIVYAGQGETKCNIVKWYVPAGESIWCQQYEDVGAFQFVFGYGWHVVGQNWNSCVTHLIE